MNIHDLLTKFGKAMVFMNAYDEEGAQQQFQIVKKYTAEKENDDRLFAFMGEDNSFILLQRFKDDEIKDLVLVGKNSIESIWFS